MKSTPDWSIESQYEGLIVAIDEVGRGPLAGPVMAAAAVVDARRIPDGLNDSKKLTARRREALFDSIMSQCRVEIGVASVEEIEQLNILGATKLAMRRAYDALGITPVVALVDGNQPPDLPCPVRCVVGGDAKCLSIAAASIVAKVVRDRHMADLAKAHPHYGWERNAGYGTRAHLDGLAQHGITPHHRRGFRPICDMLAESPALPQAASR
jgi:ribonuclease HII